MDGETIRSSCQRSLPAHRTLFGSAPPQECAALLGNSSYASIKVKSRSARAVKRIGYSLLAHAAERAVIGVRQQ